VIEAWKPVHTYQPATCPPVEQLVSRFRDRSATVAIIGLGYVGLPLVQALLDNGLAVIGIDIDVGKVAALKEGRTYIHHIPAEGFREPIARGRSCRASISPSLGDPEE
jgi:UDP-N-acetyl-D-glucosamine dehydrogenase